MAIDYLGTIAGRLKKFTALLESPSEDHKDGDTSQEQSSLKEGGWFARARRNLVKGEVSLTTDLEALVTLWRCQGKVLEFLERGARQDAGLKVGRE